MSLKKIIPIGLFALILVGVACFETKGPSDPVVIDDPDDPDDTVIKPTAQSFGTFRVQLIPENPELSNPAYTNFVGMMKDGPIPPLDIFKEQMVSGQCRLFKKYNPKCSDCSSDGMCVADDSCMSEPNAYSVGNMTLTGMKSGGEPLTYISEPGDRAFDYQISSPYPDYPPANEGDIITFAAAGTGSVEPFTIEVPCIAPLVFLNDEIVLEDGKDITLNWEPPKVAGISTISIRFNLSYHGGTKGEIQCETEDDGSVTIPGAMIDKLKSYGTAGYPCVYITRQAVVVDEKSKAKATVECTITKMLTIPGEISCSGDETGNGVCPEGTHCIDRKCQ